MTNSTYKEAIKEWCEKNLSEALAQDLDQGTETTCSTFAKMGQDGILGDPDSTDIVSNLVILMETVASYSGTMSNAVAVNASCSMLLKLFGGAEHKQLAKQILTGKCSAAFLLTEEFAGSDIPNLQCSATEGQEGILNINGEKWFATGAANSEWLLVVVKSKQDDAIQKSTSIICIPATTPGVTITPMPKLASKGYPSCRVKFENVSVSKDCIVGAENQAWGYMAFTGGVERLLVAAASVGLSDRILKYVARYSLERKVEGAPIFEKQAISHRLAHCYTQIDAARLLVIQATKDLASGVDPSKAICMAKLFASEMQQEVSDMAIRVLGGRAYLETNPVSRWQREGQLSLYAGGTNEIQKNLIARSLKKKVM